MLGSTRQMSTRKCPRVDSPNAGRPFSGNGAFFLESMLSALPFCRYDRLLSDPRTRLCLAIPRGSDKVSLCNCWWAATTDPAAGHMQHQGIDTMNHGEAITVERASNTPWKRILPARDLLLTRGRLWTGSGIGRREAYPRAMRADQWRDPPSRR